MSSYIYINSILMLFVLVHQMPMGRFLLGVFVAPVLLGLLFTPIFLLDMGGLAFDGSNLAETFPAEGPVASAKRRFSAVLNIFLYAYGLKLLIFVAQWGFNIYLQVHLFIVYQSFMCELLHGWRQRLLRIDGTLLQVVFINDIWWISSCSNVTILFDGG